MRLKFWIQAWKFQSRLKYPISLEIFIPDHDQSPQKGALFSIPLEIFNLAWDLQSEIGRLKISSQKDIFIFVNRIILGPSGIGLRESIRRKNISSKNLLMGFF